MFERLKVCVEERMMSASNSDSVSSDCITNDKVAYLKNRLMCTRDRARLWLRKLNTSLPGHLGQIGDWLCHAEKRLREIPSDGYDSPGSAVKSIQQHLADLSV